MTTLYLVSAEKNGTGYWKVGITKKKDPLKRDKKHYREVFRSIDIHHFDAIEIELAIAQTFCLIGNEPNCGRESLSYSHSLSTALTVFDYWIEKANTSNRVYLEIQNHEALITTSETEGPGTDWEKATWAMNENRTYPNELALAIERNEVIVT